LHRQVHEEKAHFAYLETIELVNLMCIQPWNFFQGFFFDTTLWTRVRQKSSRKQPKWQQNLATLGETLETYPYTRDLFW
jgi:hypothetical protein